jgi:hypothetical protein
MKHEGGQTRAKALPMYPTVLFLAAILYPLLGFLIFLAMDSEQMAARVPYGSAPVIMSLRSIRCVTAIIACVLWLPAVLAGYLLH